MSGFLQRIRAGETPFYAALKRVAKVLLRSSAPTPWFLNPIFRALYEFHFLMLVFCRWAVTYFYRGPLFRSLCVEVGENFQLTLLPFVRGDVQIHIGNNVSFFGKVDIGGARVFAKPRLIIRDGAGLGHLVFISVAKEVVIEEEAMVANECRIADNDRHPKDAELRAMGYPVDAKDVRPVRIGRRAWIGQGSHILKGVTIGEGAIIGTNSVVIHDIPPYCLAMGNPAQVYFRNVGRPRRARREGE